MNDVLPWLEYKWAFDFPVGMYRAVCERMRGAPGRLEEFARGLSRQALTQQPAPGKWSAQEHFGHLWVLDEELHHPRIEQYLRGETALMAADMNNKRTAESQFNAMPVEKILNGFRATREKSLRLLDGLTLQDAARVATHPRLKRELRLVDLCYFCAEHDDHHLAMARAAAGM